MPQRRGDWGDCVPQRKHGVIRQFACRARVVRVSFPFFLIIGHGEERGKQIKIKILTWNAAFWENHLHPKLVSSLSFSQSHSLTPISSASSASLFFFSFSYCLIYPYIFYSFSLLPHLGMGDVNQCMAAASQVFNFF